MRRNRRARPYSNSSRGGEAEGRAEAEKEARCRENGGGKEKENTARGRKPRSEKPRNAESAEPRSPRRNAEPRRGKKKLANGQLAELLKRAKLPRAGSIRFDPKAKVKIIPLGGLEQIGMNITAFECNDTIIVVDCGIAFPSEDMLGIDCVIPDVSYLKENRSKVKGFVITHDTRTTSAPCPIS